MNVCGVCAYKLKEEITVEAFRKKIENTFNYDKTYNWNYNKGNHFCTLCYCDGNENLEEGYYIIVHASAAEYKKGNFEEGLYPEEENWYYNEIKTYTDPETGRYLRYLDGEYAEKFWKIAHFLESFNEKRNEYFIEKTFDGLIDKKILNMQHYGMPSRNSICIGCHWREGMYALLTAPGEDIYFVNPVSSKKNRFVHDEINFTLSPHIQYQRAENIRSFFKRVYGVLDDIQIKYRDKKILIVKHAGVSRAVYCYFNGIPDVDNLIGLGLGNCEVARYICSERKFDER